MAKNKRTDMEILQDKALISELLLIGKGSTEISLVVNRRRAYNLSESQIRYDINKINEEWITTYLDNYDQSKSKELAKIDKLEQEYWQAWARSRRQKKKVLRTKSSMKGTENYEGTQDSDSRKEEMERTPGDKKFLEGIQWCIDQRCKILGLDAPTKMDLTWREKARKYKMDPDTVVEKLTEQFVEAAERGIKDEA